MAQPLEVRVEELAALYLAQGFAVAEHALTRWAQRVFERACADDGHDPAAPAAGAEPAWLARLKAELTGLTASAKGHMQGAGEAWDMSTVSQVVDKMLQFRARYAQLAGLSDDDAQALHRLTERAAQTRHLVAHGGTPVDQLVGGLSAVEALLLQLRALAVLEGGAQDALAAGAAEVEGMLGRLRGLLRGEPVACPPLGEGALLRLLLHRSLSTFEACLQPMVRRLQQEGKLPASCAGVDNPTHDASSLCMFLEALKGTETEFTMRGLGAGQLCSHDLSAPAKKLSAKQKKQGRPEPQQPGIRSARNALGHRIGTAFQRDEVLTWLGAIERVLRAFERDDVAGIRDSVREHAAACTDGADTVAAAIAAATAGPCCHPEDGFGCE